MRNKREELRVAKELRATTSLTWAQVFRLAAGQLIDGLNAREWLLDAEPEPQLTAREARNERYEASN